MKIDTEMYIVQLASAVTVTKHCTLGLTSSWLQGFLTTSNTCTPILLPALCSASSTKHAHTQCFVMGSCGVQSQQEELEDEGEGEGRRPKRRSSNAGLHYSEDLSDAMFDRLLQADDQPGSASEVTHTCPASAHVVTCKAKPCTVIMTAMQPHSMQDTANPCKSNMQNCGISLCMGEACSMVYSMIWSLVVTTGLFIDRYLCLI